MTISKLTELSANVFAFPAGHANVYLWRHEHGCTLIDAGEVGSDTVVLEVMRQLGLAERDLVRIVLTHWHHDHTGGAAALAARTNAQVCTGRADAPVIRGQEHGAPPVLTPAEEPIMAGIEGLVTVAPACAVDLELDDGDTLTGHDHGRAHILAMPGHTAGSIAVHLPGERVVLTGDIAAHPAQQVILGLFNVDRDQARHSLGRLTTLDIDAAGFGHGDPITQKAAQALSAWTDPHA